MELYNFAVVLGKITPWLLLVCLIIGLLTYSKLSVPYKFMLLYLLIILISNLGMRYMGEKYGNNLILFPIYGFFELGLFMILYGFFMNLEKLQILVYIIGSVALTYIAYECFTVNTTETSEFQSYARAIGAFIIVIFSMIYYFEKLSKGILFSDSILSLNTIILVFSSLTLIILLPLNFLIGENSQHLKFYFWIAHGIVNTIFYIIITYSIWKNGRTPIR